MDQKQLAEWCAQARPELTEAVARDIRDHLAAIPSPGDIYGYAILPGDPTTSADGISSLVAACNRPSDISVGRDEPEFTYYKFSVDEWQHWDHDRFTRTDSILRSLNSHFAAAHVSDASIDDLDELEETYAASLLGAILDGMALAQSKGVFASNVEYIVIWISDSDNTIMEESVRRLNSEAVVEEFLGEFGSEE